MTRPPRNGCTVFRYLTRKSDLKLSISAQSTEKMSMVLKNEVVWGVWLSSVYFHARTTNCSRRPLHFSYEDSEILRRALCMASFDFLLFLEGQTGGRLPYTDVLSFSFVLFLDLTSAVLAFNFERGRDGSVPFSRRPLVVFSCAQDKLTLR